MEAILATVAHVNTGEVRYAPADGIPALKQASSVTPKISMKEK